MLSHVAILADPKREKELLKILFSTPSQVEIKAPDVMWVMGEVESAKLYRTWPVCRLIPKALK
jgi:hypothetical protein